MKTINVLVIAPSFDKDLPYADAEILKRIRAVSPNIKVTDASELVTAEERGDNSNNKKLDVLLADSEIIFGFIPPKNITSRAPKLKWFQATSAGVDRHQGTEIWKSKVIITG
ncbi:MAG: hypothetical protein PHG35_06675, partial [Dehalococcoidales bacterium]|nr:hypothetical protein [Dehalococcoidales bacterium]